MSTLREVADLIDRMHRLMARAEVTPGAGQTWTAEVPGHGMQTYKLTGMKSPAEIQDDLASLSLWVWSVKDHLKALVASRGGNPEDVEEFVNVTPDLQVCADIANTAKHGQLRTSRTGRFLRAGPLHFEIPQAALASLSLLMNEVQIDLAKPDLVTFRLPLLDASGSDVGDALFHLRAGVEAWESYVERLR
jgi:hypothetical protein